MFEAGRLDQVAEEKKRFKIDILGLSETKPTQREAKRNLETYNRTRDRKRREIMVSDKSASQKQSTMEEVCSCPMFLQGITGNKSSKSSI